MHKTRKIFINIEGKTININIILTNEELDKIFERFIDLGIEGGSFSWGYDPGSSINHVVVFKKVKMVDDEIYIDDHSISPLYKAVLEGLGVFFFPLIGLYFLLSMFIYIIT